MSSTWQASLSFSERLSTIVKITAAFKAAHQHVASADASQNARSLEERMFSESSSLIDYKVRCEAVTQEYYTASSSTPEDVQLSPSAMLSNLLEGKSGKASFGRYKDAAHFRDGLFSDIYVAKVPDQNPESFPRPSGSIVALKATYLASTLPPHNSHREIRLLRRASSANVIPLLESFQDGVGHMVLVFPFMALDLSQLMRQGRIPPARARQYLKDTFQALSHLHSLGIMHRDVKPSNILLNSPSGPAYLADFGIAWAEDDAVSEPASAKITDVGTTCYRPPELLFGYTAYGFSLDIWAAGCVVAEVTNGSESTLFESGELGSELTLLQSIFKCLGTPSSQSWPETSSLPDWGKIEFHTYPPRPWSDLIPNASESARNLVGQLVRYSSSRRLTADQVLEHPYFQEIG